MKYVLFVSTDKGVSYQEKIDADFLDDEDFLEVLQEVEENKLPYYIEEDKCLYEKFIPIGNKFHPD